MAEHRYPALLNDRLTPVYDHFARLFLPEKRLKRSLIARARIAPGSRVLDMGSGSGTLAILIKQIQPEAQVTGIEHDPKILSIAREKTAQSAPGIAFHLGSAAALPYRDRSFDRVLSTLVMSVLTSKEKRLAIREAFRVLKSGGELLIADFGSPHTLWGRMVAPLVRRFEPINDNLDGLLAVMFQEAGFENIAGAERYATLFGTLSILSGEKP